MKYVGIIIPTTGANELKDAIKSCLEQTYDNIKIYVVVDGKEYRRSVDKIVNKFKSDKIFVYYLPENVGKGGFYGHRVYAGFSHLINCDYVIYLDQDCYFEPVHVENCVKFIEENNLDWVYGLRNIVDKDGNFICGDDCESLGKWNPVLEYRHVDTNCYCIKTEIIIKICQVWHGKWGQDRVFFDVISKHFPNYDCVGKYTVNYRLAGNDNSVKLNFFEYWNNKVEEFPWRKE